MDITIEDFEFGESERPSGIVKTISELQDDQLARAAANGDDDAFCHLVELHQERVFHFCYRWLQDQEDAREVTQDITNRRGRGNAELPGRS